MYLKTNNLAIDLLFINGTYGKLRETDCFEDESDNNVYCSIKRTNEYFPEYTEHIVYYKDEEKVRLYITDNKYHTCSEDFYFKDLHKPNIGELFYETFKKLIKRIKEF